MTEEVQVPKRRGRPPKNPTVEREPKRPMFRAELDQDMFNPSAENTPDRLRIPPEDIPEGYTFQWARTSIMGQPDDRNLRAKRAAGWTPVHRGDVGGRYDQRFEVRPGDEAITMDGTLVLMYMPTELYKKIQMRELKEARERVALKERQFRGGDLPVSLDATHPSAVQTNRITKSYERLDIPKE
jgi:hypothetical protein